MKKCTFKITRADCAKAKAKPVTKQLTGYEVDILGLRCFVDKRKARCWTVTEALTGFAIAGGDTRTEAIAEAKSRMENVGPGGVATGLIKSARSVWKAGLKWPVNA